MEILITGGIGDYFTLDAFMTEEVRKNITCIYYATPQAPHIINLAKTVMPKVKNINLTNNSHVFYRKEEVTQYLKYRRTILPEEWNKVIDYSINAVFPILRSNDYQESSFLKTKLADISKFDLPKSYALICPASTNHQPGRNFASWDWTNLLPTIKKGVVLFKGPHYKCPKNHKLIDFTNKTNLLESIEILKGASEYIGVDSCLSVLATKLPIAVMVKSKNKWLYEWSHIYFAPKNHKIIIDSIPTPPTPIVKLL